MLHDHWRESLLERDPTPKAVEYNRKRCRQEFEKTTVFLEEDLLEEVVRTLSFCVSFAQFAAWYNAGHRPATYEGTLGDPDREQLRYAVANEWVLLTFDDDFLTLVEGQGLEHRGVIYVQQAGRQIGDVVKVVDEHLQNRSEDDQSIQYV